jgi:ElaA protein
MNVTQIKLFSQLDTHTLYQLLKARVDVFVVEQACAYPEIDDLDCHISTAHVLSYLNGTLQAYARCLAPKTVHKKYSAIGRVLVTKEGRGQGVAKQLMLDAIDYNKATWPQHEIKISAQTYLLNFYQGLGFTSVGDAYLEDGISHQDMILFDGSNLTV